MNSFVKLTILAVAVGALSMAAGAEDAKLTAPGKKLMDQAKDADGYKPLFKENLSNAVMQEGGWAFEDGVLTAKGKGDIWTKERYGNFVLDLEFKCDPETNSGVFIRTADLDQWLHTAIEVQVLQPNDHYDNDKHHCGGIFDCLAPSKQVIKKAGEWNHYIIIAQDNMIYVILNGEQVVGMDLDQWTEAHKNPDGTKNKFKYPYKEMAREGHFGLQYHGHPVWFRNLKVKKLKK
jgi:3-keto-disaccharide hydrolase